MTMDEARQIAAQAWCDPETSGIEMDIRLAEAFAKRLVASRSSSGSGEREAGRADGLDEAASVLVGAWDDGEQGRSMGDPEDTAEVRLLRGRAAAVRALTSDPPSPGSGERLTPLDDAETTEAMLEAEVAKLTAQRTMTVHRLGGAVEGAPTHAGNFLQRIDALRAIEAASGDRVRVLEEALRESRRCGDKLAKELRGWRDTYVSDDEEDPEGWLALDGWAKSSDARDRALSPQGDGPRPVFIPGGAFCGCGQVEFVCPGSAVARTWSPGAKWPMLHRPDGCRLATDEEIRNLDPSTPEGQPQGDGAVSDGKGDDRG